MMDGEGNLWIPLEEFYKWLLDNHAKHLSGSEVAFGPTTISDGCLRIRYAFSDECHPSEWAKKPEWMK